MRLERRERQDGDGWVVGACGERHWGTHGSAGLLLQADGQVLLQHRVPWSHHGGTWGIPGGARRSDEDALAAALREAAEEAGVAASVVLPVAELRDEHGGWSYTTVVAEAVAGSPRPDAAHTDVESLEVRWVDVGAVEELPLHPGFAATWSVVRGLLGRRVVLVVDGANVVGSRPDGWWRDRAGAAGRLAGRLRVLADGGMAAGQLGLEVEAAALRLRWWPEVVLVVEGAARAVADDPATSHITVRRAPGSGDDEIVRVVAQARTDRPQDHVVVVTADRELRDRVRALGATVIGPRALDESVHEAPIGH